MNTIIHLTYRDRGNYKTHLEVGVKGELTPELQATFDSKLYESMFVIPDQAGLPHPAEDCETDHIWVEAELEATDRDLNTLDGIISGTLKEFIEQMPQEWDEYAEFQRVERETWGR